MGMHPVLQRSSTYAGVPQLVTGGAVSSSPVHTSNNNRRWSLPEMPMLAIPLSGMANRF